MKRELIRRLRYVIALSAARAIALALATWVESSPRGALLRRSNESPRGGSRREREMKQCGHDAALVQQVIDRAAGEKRDFDFEHCLAMPDGSVKYLHVVAHAVREETDKPQFMGAIMDITARKAAEGALRDSEQRYRHLFHYMPIALLQVNTRDLKEISRGLRARGVVDLAAYMGEHPDFLDALIVEEVNQRAVEMLGARAAHELTGSLAPYWQRNPDTSGAPWKPNFAAKRPSMKKPRLQRSTDALSM
jgi:PAS domain-containing protein